MVDKGTLTQANAKTIVKNTHDISHHEQSQKQMLERAEWLLSLNREDREVAKDAMETLKHGVPIKELKEYVDKENSRKSRTISYAIPSEQYDDLIKWGKSRGLELTTHHYISYL